MKSMMRKTTFREIKGSFGRFASIMAIIGLGVAFFCGIKVTKQAMSDTVANFYDEKNFFDLHLMSTMGYDEENVDAFAEVSDVEYAEGVYIFDALYDGVGDSQVVYKTFSMPENVNGYELVEGELPTNENECLVDYHATDIQVGDVITLAEENSDDTSDAFAVTEFTVVGKCYSAYYINFERGTTSLGNGQVAGFIYVPPDAFDCDYYTDVFVTFDCDFDLYAEEYDDYIDEKTSTFETLSEDESLARYRRLLVDAGIPEEYADEMEPEEGEVTTYVLDRNTNVGYVCFDSDSEIVNSVAKVFPIFFILVAALVCMTTMNRMVEEQRTQIGVLKALGYKNGTIMAKYMTYSGLAATIGCLAGFFIGTAAFPQIIWYAYHMMYISIPMDYIFSLPMFVGALLVALACSLGTTWFSCRVELTSTAANLMRPKAPKAGKRIFLEHITFIWKRMKFLNKVSARNVFRYKKRFFMMIIGISGCTALLLTGFGLKDSISDFANQQYDEIEVADATFALSSAADPEDDTTDLAAKLNDDLADYMYAACQSMDIVLDGKVKSINLVMAQDESAFDNYIYLKTTDGDHIAYPGNGEAVINDALAKRYDISVGDEILLQDADMNEITVTVSGIFENHVYNYVIMSTDTYQDALGEEPEYKNVYVNFKDTDDAHEVAATFLDMDEVTTVTINADTAERLTTMLASLNYVVALVIGCAAALAFIVLYNLTNINITERIREIATIKVLGFFKKETSSYVFRENRVLTAVGCFVGLFLGVLLHSFVMSQIQVDLTSFTTYIAPVSFVYSIVLTFVFNTCVNLVMARRLEEIDMAESLKSVD